eukprot:scaffold12382_cov118-Isochrysis_galbana.AAC.2
MAGSRLHVQQQRPSRGVSSDAGRRAPATGTVHVSQCLGARNARVVPRGADEQRRQRRRNASGRCGRFERAAILAEAVRKVVVWCILCDDLAGGGVSPRISPLAALLEREGQARVEHRAQWVKKWRVHHRGPHKIGRHVEQSAERNPPRRRGARRAQRRPRIAPCVQRAHRALEVGRRAPFVQAAAAGVPPRAELASPAHVRECQNPASPEQRQPLGPIFGRQACTVRAVHVHEHRRVAGRHQTTPVRHGHRNTLAVVRARPPYLTVDLRLRRFDWGVRPTVRLWRRPTDGERALAGAAEAEGIRGGREAWRGKLEHQLIRTKVARARRSGEGDESFRCDERSVGRTGSADQGLGRVLCGTRVCTAELARWACTWPGSDGGGLRVGHLQPRHREPGDCCNPFVDAEPPVPNVDVLHEGTGDRRTQRGPRCARGGQLGHMHCRQAQAGAGGGGRRRGAHPEVRSGGAARPGLGAALDPIAHDEEVAGRESLHYVVQALLARRDEQRFGL